MTANNESVLACGLDAVHAEQFAEAYALLLPLAEAGNIKAQDAVGFLLKNSVYRFDSMEQFQSPSGGRALDAAAILFDRKRAFPFLSAASAAGIGSASFNLASLYIEGFDDMPWADRFARAKELCVLALSQGFTAFPWLAGEPYLGQMKRLVEDSRGSEAEPRDAMDSRQRRE